MWLSILHCFFLTLITVFSYVYISLFVSIILSFSQCFYFHLLFPYLFATRHILHFTMFDSISLQPARNITEIRNTSQPTTKERKRFASIMRSSNIFVKESMSFFFLLIKSLSFQFLIRLMLSHHILRSQETLKSSHFKNLIFPSAYY